MPITHKITVRHFLRGALKIVRVKNLLILILTQYLARILLIGPRNEWKQIVRDPDMVLISLSTALIAAAGYIINDYFDIKIDIINKPHRVVVGRFLGRRLAMSAHQILSVAGVALGIFINRWVLLINILSVTMLWLYSERFKRLPLIGNVAVACLTALSLLVLTARYPQNRNLIVIYAFFSFAITLIREIIKDMEDIRGDAAHGCQTLPIVWGIRKTKYFVLVLIAGFVAELFFLAQSINAHIVWIFSFLLIPISLLTIWLILADTRRKFARLSELAKIIMLAGLVTMYWAS